MEMDLENINENEESEEIEFENIRVPINNAEIKEYEKSFFLKGTNLYCEPTECNNENLKVLTENYATIPEKLKEQFFERDCQTIRWKYDEANKIKSNAKVIEWSDGSFSIQIGNELYDLALSDMNDIKLFSVYKNTLFIAQNTIKQKALCKSQKKV